MSLYNSALACPSQGAVNGNDTSWMIEPSLAYEDELTSELEDVQEGEAPETVALDIFAQYAGGATIDASFGSVEHEKSTTFGRLALGPSVQLPSGVDGAVSPIEIDGPTLSSMK